MNVYFKKFEGWRNHWENYESSFISNLYEGSMLCELTCLNCKFRSNYFEKFGDLSLDINKQMSYSKLWSEKNNPPLFDLISHFFKDETIQDFKCENCKKKTDVIKTHNFITFPRILIILIKRFLFYPKPKKLNQKIDFTEEELDLTPFYCDYYEDKSHRGKSFFKNEKKKGIYKLKGFINHFGDIDFGHYTACIHLDQHEKWFHFNDEEVSVIKDSHVKKNSAENVYVLFYERIF